jgi:hypothetical protein
MRQVWDMYFCHKSKEYIGLCTGYHQVTISDASYTREGEHTRELRYTVRDHQGPGFSKTPLIPPEVPPFQHEEGHYLHEEHRFQPEQQPPWPEE